MPDTSTSESSAGLDNVLEWDETLSSDDRGMYGGGEDTYIETLELEDSEDAIKADLEQGNYANRYGWYNGDTQSDSDINPFFGVSDNGTKANILGLPFPFNKQADPSGRVFKSTIMTDLPLLFVVPGKTILNNKLVTDNGGKIGRGKLLTLLEEGVLDVLKLGVMGAKSGSDLRFLGFKQDYKTYYKYVDTMLNVVHANMGLPGLYSFSDSFDANAQSNNGLTAYGLCFYMEKSTSIQEGNSNDYTTTSVAQQANDLAAQNREAKMMLGINTGGDSKSIVGKALNFVAQAASELTEGITSLTGILSRSGNIFGRVVNGSQLSYPDIWTNSVSDKGYNLSFKFYSPYGDIESIFNYCYVPFISWIALAYPVQDNVMGYGQPFVMKINAPGYIIGLVYTFLISGTYKTNGV